MMRLLLSWIFCIAFVYGIRMLADHVQGQEISFTAFVVVGLAGSVVATFSDFLWPSK